MAKPLKNWTTEALKKAIRERESPEFAKARSVSDQWVQSELDCLCEELGKREEC